MAANNQNYYFILKNQDISGIITDYELPNGDTSRLISGFISGSNIDEQVLSRANNIIKYKNSVYPKNGVVIDTGTTQEHDDPLYPQGIKTFPLKEDGYYYIQMSSAGGRGENKNRFNGTWKIEDNNGNTSDLDQIWIYEQNNPQTATYKELISGVEISTNEYTYTWERIKKGQGDEKTVWKGNYVYLNNTVFLSRLTIDDFKYEEENYGILMFKNDFGDNKFKLFSYRIDDEVDDENIKYVSSGYNSDFNTKDAKGGDGEFYNDIVCLSKGAIGYYVGKGERRPAFPDSPGGDTHFQNINKTLNGGIIPENNDFGGRGGSFVYDYWGRIKYNESWPEDGKFLITYLGAANSVYNNITIETDSNIIKVSCPA